MTSRNRHSAPVAQKGEAASTAGRCGGAGNGIDFLPKSDTSVVPERGSVTATAMRDEALTQSSTIKTTPRLRAGTSLLCALAISAAGVAAHAQPIPVPPASIPLAPQSAPTPKAAPKARSKPDASASETKPATPAPVTTASTSRPPEPFIPDPRRNVPTSIFTTFDANQKALAGKVSAYLSSVQTLVGNFVQVGPDGSRTKGDFYIQKPGKVRFEYDDPSPIAIVSDGSSLVVRDRKLATQDVYPLSQTPLRFLLSDRIDLMKDTNVVSVSADDTFISITIEEKNAIIGTSRLMLMVGTKDNQLKQWTVTDPQGYDTTVAVYNLDATKRQLDPSLFKIDFTAYPTSPG